MPIRPENKSLYPDNWKDIRAAILERANSKCELCGVLNYSFREKTRIVLTIMHLNHDPTDNRSENLKAGCQKCHLAYDKEHHRKSRLKNKYLDREKSGQEKLC